MRRTLVRSGLVLVLSLVCARIVINLVGSIDWRAVVAGLGHVNAWQITILVAVLVVRQILNASPLTLFIDRLSLFRATLSDQAATLMSMIAPPPSDMVLRISIFRSWGIESARGLAGATMNVLVFYVNRFLAPVAGFLLLLTVRFEPSYAGAALVGLVIAGSILGLVVAVTSKELLAQTLGERLGRYAAVVRRSVDPSAWGRSLVDFRGHVAERLRRGLPRSLAALMAMVVVDGFILLLALRFVGVEARSLPAIEVLAAFLVLYPLTLFPLQGTGLLDAMLVAALTAVAGIEHEAAVVASLMIYRVVTLGAPAVLGALALGWWRRSAARNLAEPAEQAR